MSTIDHIRETVARIYMGLAPGGRAPLEGERGELDSLAFLEFIVAIEREFAIAIPTEDLEDDSFATTASTAAYLQARLISKAAA